jgi:putative ABC transport system permease protein
MLDRLYAVAYLQEVVAAVVAALGVATTLLISLLQRRRELGLLRAVGATPAQAAGVVFAEAALLTGLGLLAGLAIGAALEWYMLRVVLLEETGFVFPFRFPWAHAGLVVGLVALGGGLAGLGPALRASRLQIVEAIAYE